MVSGTIVPSLRRRRDAQFLPGGLLPPLKLVEQQILGAAASSVTFSSISSTVGTHLVAQVYARLVNNASADLVKVQFNGDSGNNYNREGMFGTDAAPSAAINSGVDGIGAMALPGGTTYPNGFGGGFFLIPHAFNTSKHKNLLSANGSAEHQVRCVLGRWADTSAITSIVLVPDNANSFIAGSIITLWAVDDKYLLDSSILSGADGTFSFTSIPQQYAALCVIGDLKSDRNADVDAIDCQMNGDATATNYHDQYLFGQNADSPTAASENADRLGQCVGSAATAPAQQFGPLLALFPAYAEADNDPAYLSVSGQHASGTPHATIMVLSGRRNNVEAVNRLDFIPGAGGTNFKDGSGCWLYGIPKPRSKRVGRVKLSADAASVTFANIPQTGRSLTLRVYARTDRDAASDGIDISFNGDTTASNYDRQYLQGTGASVNAARSAATRTWQFCMANASGSDNEWGASVLVIHNYASTVGHKHGTLIGGLNEDDVEIRSCRWEGTSPIRTISMTPSTADKLFLADSIFELTIED
jgi:hypothetical protein